VSAHTGLAGFASAVCALAVAADAFGCGETLRTVDGRASNARFEIAFAVVPAPIVTGALFALDIVVCPRAGVAPPTGLAVDAVMPEHRHGMNYRPTVAARGPGTYRAEGLLFHMPGRWDLLFDVDTGAGAERLAATLHLQ
jgi:hypothetical protein